MQLYPILMKPFTGFIEAELSFSENELQCESLQKGNGENLDAQVTASIGMKAVVLD